MAPVEKSKSIGILNSVILLLYIEEISNCGASSKSKTKPMLRKDNYG